MVLDRFVTFTAALDDEALVAVFDALIALSRCGPGLGGRGGAARGPCMYIQVDLEVPTRHLVRGRVRVRVRINVRVN